jgi:phosphatidylinositol 4-kinase
MEFVPNSISISSLKKKLDAEYGNKSLSKFFSLYFKDNVEKATNNFIQSLAGYSLITYLLNIKDRHNGNILMINTGEIIHIDFGYSLGLTPAGVGFEKAPFKLTNGFLEIIGDENSTNFFNFKSLFCQGLIAARKYYDIFQNILITMSKSGLSCFEYMPVVEMLKEMEKRFLVTIPNDKLIVEIERIIQNAEKNWRTKIFDKYNKCSNGIQ